MQYCMQKPPGRQQVIAVAAAVTYERWNFTRGFIIGFDGENSGVLDERSLIGGGC